MIKHLIKTTETYRIDNDENVKSFLEELKRDPNFELAKYSSTKKVAKEKGEIVDEWIHLEVTKIFDDEKMPMNDIEISYNAGE
jgi:hypothetical protein